MENKCLFVFFCQELDEKINIILSCAAGNKICLAATRKLTNYHRISFLINQYKNCSIKTACLWFHRRVMGQSLILIGVFHKPPISDVLQPTVLCEMVSCEWLTGCDLTQMDQIPPDLIHCSQNRKWTSFTPLTHVKQPQKHLQKHMRCVCMHTHRHVSDSFADDYLPSWPQVKVFSLLGVFRFLWKIPMVYTNILLIARICVCRNEQFFSATSPCWSIGYFQFCRQKTNVSNTNGECATGLCCCRYFNGAFIVLILLSAF